MSTMNISLPEAMRSFIDEQFETKGCSTSSEYMRDLIRREQDRLHVRHFCLMERLHRSKPLQTMRTSRVCMNGSKPTLNHDGQAGHPAQGSEDRSGKCS